MNGGPCIVCGTTDGPFEMNHLGTRKLWPEIWFWFCVPCHDTFTSFQMALGIVRAGPDGKVLTARRGEVGRNWALFEGAVIASIMATDRCEACRATVTPMFTLIGQGIGVVSEMLADDRREPPVRTDPVGADSRPARPMPDGVHERALLEMMLVVLEALTPELTSLCHRIHGTASLHLMDGRSWQSEFGPEFLEVLEGVLASDRLADAWNVLVEHPDLEDRMLAKIEADLSAL